jgi:hypothetical protein
MHLPYASYATQRALWPPEGRALLASYDDEAVVVNQACRPQIADWVARHGRFGGPWSFSRMSWIKPGFLWMMVRSSWASKPDQERVLAIRFQRAGFDEVLARAVPSRDEGGLYPDRDATPARTCARPWSGPTRSPTPRPRAASGSAPGRPHELAGPGPASWPEAESVPNRFQAIRYAFSSQRRQFGGFAHGSLPITHMILPDPTSHLP